MAVDKKHAGNRNRDDLDIEYWTEGEGLVKIEEWLEAGLFDKQIANNIGIAFETLSRWKRKHELVGLLFKKARKEINIQLVNATFKSAQGYYVEEEALDVKGNKHTLKKWIAPNSSAQIFLLKNWMKEQYKDKHDVTVEGAIPIVLSGHDELKD